MRTAPKADARRLEDEVLRPDDESVVTSLLGRAPAGSFTVAVRRPDGQPVVIENAPLLGDGTPMPTRFWLVDPDLRARVDRLEAAGGVRQAEAHVDEGRLAECHRRYEVERNELLPVEWAGPRPSGGVGGTRQGVKCLHAHLAWWLAGGDDPVGAWVSEVLALSREHTSEEPVPRDRA